MCRGWQDGDREVRTFRGGPQYLDRCIVGLIDALNRAGIETVASCCGHGVRPGNIMLRDGRELIIATDFETARQVDRAFPPLNPPQTVP